MSAPLPTFGPEAADCASCELKGRCKGGRWVSAAPPTLDFNRLMVIGEGPGANELAQKKPFVGPSGQLLNALLETAGIEREATYITNATLAFPPAKSAEEADSKAGFVKRFPGAVPSCLSRLEKEIEAVRPRVIVCLGQAAVLAALGKDVAKARQVKFDCPHCGPDRKIGPAIKCAVGDCDWYELLPGLEGDALKDAHQAVLDKTGGKCPKCEANIKRLRPRRIACLVCGGRKTRIEAYTIFKSDYRLDEVLGGSLFETQDLPSKWDAFGVKYVICAWHPAYILRSGKKAANERSFGGQFLARAVADYFVKARGLLTRDRSYELNVVQDDELEGFLEATAASGHYTLDIETNAKSPWDVTELRCLGLTSAGSGKQFVFDPRDVLEMQVELAPPRPPVVTKTVLKLALYEAIRAFLIDPLKPKRAQGGDYDYIVLRRFFDVEVGPISGDTKVAHHALYPDESHTLGVIAAEMTQATHWKEPKDQGGVLKYENYGELVLYNARDVKNTDDSLEVMAGKPLDPAVPTMVSAPTGVSIRRWSTGGRVEDPEIRTRLGYDVAIALYPIAIEMEFKGIPISTERLQEADADFKPRVDASMRFMREFTSRDDFSPTKDVDLQWALFDPQGPCKITPTVFSEKTKKPSTAKEVLARIQDIPFVYHLLQWRKYSKFRNDYVFGKKLILREDGRLHTAWNSAGTVTWRWSSSPNFQNWPRALRRAVKAPPGWKIVGSDYAQLEARIMAALSGDPELIRRCRDADSKRKLEPDWDVHSYVASKFFGEAFTLLDYLNDPAQKIKREAEREAIKCLHPAMLVYLPDRVQPVSAFCAGEGDEGPLDPCTIVVSARAGKGDPCPGMLYPVKATAWRQTGEQEMVHVATRRGIVTCSREHRLLLADGRRKAAAELKRGDALAPTDAPTWKGRTEAVVVLPGGAIRGLPRVSIQTNPAWAYFAGLFLGDGSVSGHSVVLTHGERSKTDRSGYSYGEWADEMASALAGLGFVPQCKDTMVVIGNRHACRVLGVLGLTDHKPVVGNAQEHVKGMRVFRVPQWILDGTREMALAFLAGLVDTDGYVDIRRGSARITNKDAVFMGQLCVVIRMLGMTPTVEPQWNKDYQRWYWTVGMRACDSFQLHPWLRHRSKREKLRDIKPTGLRPGGFDVKLVAPAPSIRCIDLQIDHPAHSFVQNGLLGSNSVFYGLNYGAGDNRILATIAQKGAYDGPPLTLRLVKGARLTIFREFPGIPRWRDEAVRQATRNLEVRSAVLGRWRPFPLPEQLGGGVDAPVAWNFPIQSTAADIMDLRMLFFHQQLRECYPEAWIALQVHDAIYTLCPERDAEGVRQLQEDCLSIELALVEGAPPMPFVAKAKIGDDWAEVS